MEKNRQICVISPICEISIYDIKAEQRVLEEKETNEKREGLWINVNKVKGSTGVGQPQ